MTGVKPRGVTTQYAAHAVREVRRRSLDHAVVMRVEERRGVDRPLTLARDGVKAREIRDAVTITGTGFAAGATCRTFAAGQGASSKANTPSSKATAV